MTQLFLNNIRCIKEPAKSYMYIYYSYICVFLCFVFFRFSNIEVQYLKIGVMKRYILITILMFILLKGKSHFIYNFSFLLNNKKYSLFDARKY